MTTKSGSAYVYKEGALQLIYQLPNSFTLFFICEQARDGSYWIFTPFNALNIKGTKKKAYHFPTHPIRLIQDDSSVVLEMNDFKYQKFKEDQFTPFSCLLYTSPSPRDATLSRMPSSA